MINVAVLWLITNTGELLLARRADHKKQDPGVWGPTVTGKMESGETFRQTLTREVNEELSLTVNHYNPIFLSEVRYSHPDGETRVFCIYYALVNRDIPSQIQFDTNEVAEIQWFTQNQVNKMLESEMDKLVPSAKVVWPMTFEELQKALKKNAG